VSIHFEEKRLSMEHVEAGLIANITNLIKTLSDAFFKLVGAIENE